VSSGTLHAFTVKDGRRNRPQGENFKVHLELFKASIVGIALAVLSDVTASSGTLFIIAKFLVSTVAILSLCSGKTQGACLLVILLVAGRAIQLTDAGDHILTASIWSGSVGPLTPSLIVCALLVLQAFKNFKSMPSGIFRFATIWFAVVPTFAGIAYGNFSDSYARNYFKTDLRLPLMLFLGWHVFSAVCRADKSASTKLIISFFGALLARHSTNLLYSFSSVAGTLTSANAISMCPAKGLVITIFYLGILGLLYTKKTLLFSLASTCSLYMLLTYSSRHLYITALLGIFALPKLVSKKQFVAGIPVIFTVFVAALFLLILIRPDTAHYVYLRTSTFFDPARTTRGIAVDYNFFSAIDPVRYAEILNIVHQSFTKGSILWGQGYGGWFPESIAPLHVDLKNAYPPEQLSSGRFFYAHDFPPHIYLKYGFTGLLILILLWVKPIRHALTELRINAARLNSAERTLWLLNAALICTVPTAILSLWWSGKGCVLTGLILALLSATPHFGLRKKEVQEPSVALKTAT